MIDSLRRALTAPGTVCTYLLLVAPLALGWLENDLMSPLALPGYLIYVVGSAIGHAILPWLDLRLFWIPFLVGCYGVAVVVGVVVGRLRGVVDADSSDRPHRSS